MTDVSYTTSSSARRSPARLDPSVVARLQRVAKRLRMFLLVEGLAYFAAYLLAAVLIQFALDYSTRGLQWSMRAALLGAIVVSSLWLFYKRIVRPLRVRWELADVANLVERQHPELDSSLISAVRFAGGEVGKRQNNSPDLIASVIASVSQRTKSVDFDEVLNPDRAKRGGAVLIGVLVVASGAIIASPTNAGLWFQRNVLLQNVEWPRLTHLQVELDGDELIGARGDDLIVQASAKGVQPREVSIVYETKSGERGRDVMVTVGSAGAYHYRYTFKSAQEDFSFYLVGGDDQTESVNARLLERPRVTHSEMRVTPPAYTNLETITFGDGQRAAEVLPGASVMLRVQVNKPITNILLMAGREKVAEVSQDGDAFVARFSPLETHTYHFAITDEFKLENRRPTRFSLRVVQDEPPRARMKLVGVGDMITPEAMVPIELDCADAFGLDTVELSYQLSREGADQVTLLSHTLDQGATTFTTTIVWSAAEYSVQPGEVITLRARATDLNTVTGPGIANAPEATLRVVTREEFLAEMSRREQEYRMDFEGLVDSQEQLRRDLLSVYAAFMLEANAEALAVDLAPLERRQRNIAGSINIIRQQFEQILAELSVNQLDTKDERERLGDGIVAPLMQLAKRDQTLAADTIRQWSREASQGVGDTVDPQQIAILSQMRAVLASMIEWEGYQEVVGMLRDIIRLQHELQAETKDALQDQAGDVFDD